MRCWLPLCITLPLMDVIVESSFIPKGHLDILSLTSSLCVFYVPVLVCRDVLHELQGGAKKQLSRLQLGMELPVVYHDSGHLCPERPALSPAHHGCCWVEN